MDSLQNTITQKMEIEKITNARKKYEEAKKMSLNDDIVWSKLIESDNQVREIVLSMIEEHTETKHPEVPFYSFSVPCVIVYGIIVIMAIFLAIIQFNFF